jgi:hypothetical protein
MNSQKSRLIKVIQGAKTGGNQGREPVRSVPSNESNNPTIEAALAPEAESFVRRTVSGKSRAKIKFWFTKSSFCVNFDNP